MLFPPLVDDEEDDEINHAGENLSLLNVNEEKPNSVLSDKLKDRFASMRALLRKDQKEKEGSSELKRKQRRMAIETALKIESEVARLESGIAELENLLGQQQQQQLLNNIGAVDDDDGNILGGVLVLPSLPSIVAIEDEDVVVTTEDEIAPKSIGFMARKGEILCDN
jgi:hypothetical protein